MIRKYGINHMLAWFKCWRGGQCRREPTSSPPPGCCGFTTKFGKTKGKLHSQASRGCFPVCRTVWNIPYVPRSWDWSRNGMWRKTRCFSVDRAFWGFPALQGGCAIAKEFDFSENIMIFICPQKFPRSATGPLPCLWQLKDFVHSLTIM